MRGCDWAFGRPGGAALKAAGVEFVVRYYSRDLAKNLTVAEVADYLPRGIGIWPIWEAVGNAALGGAPQGQRDASDAISEARATGQPSGTVIGAAIDFDPTPAQLVAVNAYQRAFSAIVRGAGYHAGSYGPLHLLETWLADGSIDYGVEAVAWAHGGTAVLTQVVQQLAQQTINGVTVDLDIARVPYFGQWKASPSMIVTVLKQSTGEVFTVDPVLGKRHSVAGPLFFSGPTPPNAVHGYQDICEHGPDGKPWIVLDDAVIDAIPFADDLLANAVAAYFQAHPIVVPPPPAPDTAAIAAAVLADLKSAGVVVFHG